MIEFKRPILLFFRNTGSNRHRIHMPNQEPKRVLAVVSDLFFSVKLTEAAKRAGMALEFVKEPEQVMEKAKARPQLIVFDLNFDAADPLALIGKLKGSADTKSIS